MPSLFGTKAETLERLAPLLTTARVLPQVRCTVDEWRRTRSAVWERLRAGGWLERPVIVRSSALCEDQTAASLAGQFVSVPHVQGADDVAAAIERVVASYAHPLPGDQVFLQPQLTGLTVSGVAFGFDPVTGGPYVVVNDQRSPHPGAVTSGVASDDELFYWLKGTAPPAEAHLAAVVRLLDELERLLETDALDVEFAWDDATLFLLQVRPLARAPRGERSPDDCRREIGRIAQALAQRESAYRQVLGAGVAWGAMPDWNPAEMIGLRPRPLAAALYRECLTDRIWAEQRRRYGYRDVTGVPLLECFGGVALIDIRASFTSFVPADVSDATAQKLVAAYLATLRSRPELHDKVELELLHHCWTFDLAERLAAAPQLDDAERAQLERALYELTLRSLHPQTSPAVEDLRRMEAFEAWLADRPQRPTPPTAAELRELLRRCRDDGGYAFAGLARVAFIAVSLVDSLVRVGVWTEQDRERFFNSQQTVLSQLHADRTRLPVAEWLSRYGHLRPGTYDILVPRYDEAPQRYLLPDLPEPLAEPARFVLDAAQSRRLAGVLSQHGLPFAPDEFVRRLSAAVVAREYGKFVYSRGVSELLRRLGEYAAGLGWTREDCSYADQSLWDAAAPDAAFPERLRGAIAAGRAAEEAAQGVALPPLVLSAAELFSFRWPRCQPNYVTRGVACGPVRELQLTRPHPAAALAGAVVFLPSADPGFDWIFAAGIAGLVTKFGGANSHMAIRAREWNLPAAIGVGEVRYRRLVQSPAVRVDCLHQRLVPVP